MKRLLSIVLLATILSATSYAQPQAPGGQQNPQGPRPMMTRTNVPPASPQNAMHAPILPFRKTIVEKVAYNAYEESNAHVSVADVVFIGDSITENWYTFHHDFFDKNNFIWNVFSLTGLRKP